MKNKAGVLFVVLSAVCFSLAGVLIKLLPWSPLTINGARNIFASCVMLLWMRRNHKRLTVSRSTMLGACCNAAMNVTFVAATKLTTAANAIVLQFTMPFFLIVYTAVFFHKKPVLAEIAACVAVIIGILCFFMDSLSAGGMAGNILAVVSGALYAVVFMIKRLPGSDFESAAVYGQWMSILIGIPFFFTETVCETSHILIVVLLGTVQLGLAYVFLSLGLERVSPVTAAITSTIEPVLNPCLAAIFYPEPIGVVSLIGALIVISSVGIYNVFTARRGAV